MNYNELREKFEGKIVNDEEFEMLEDLLEVEFDRIDSEYYGVYKYSAISEDGEEYFDFYYNQEI